MTLYADIFLLIPNIKALYPMTIRQKYSAFDILFNQYRKYPFLLRPARVFQGCNIPLLLPKIHVR